MVDLLSALFDTDEFPPRWDFGPWTAIHSWVHITSDVSIFTAYVAISAVLGYFAFRRKDVPFLPVLWLFAAFILFCGVGHLIEASLYYWHPWYRLSGLVKVCTATASCATILALPRIVPQALALPGLSNVNQALEREIGDRGKAEDRFLSAIVDIAGREHEVEALRASEELFRSAFEDTNVAMIVTGIDNRFVRVNAAFGRLFGYSPAELLEMSMGDFTHPDHLAESYAQREALLAGEIRFFQIEKRYLHKDGRVFWGLTNVSLVRDALGQPLQYLGQVQEITERRHAEEALRESQLRSRLIVETANDPFIAVAVDGTITEWNAQAAATFGWTQEEILGRSLQETVIPPQFRESYTRGLQQFLATGQVPILNKRIEIEALHRDGRQFPVELTVWPIRIGGTYTFGAFLRDITERRHAEERFRASVEEAQRQSDESFQLLVDSAQDYAIFMLDPEGRIATWNEGAKRIKGYQAEEILGRHFSCFYPAADIAANKPEQELAAARQLGQVEDEGWRLRRDGSCYWANVAITALWDRAGQLRGYAKVTRDFTRRKEFETRITQLNTELAARVSELRDVNRELESFCYSVSHDLRAPLRAIDGFSRIVLNDFESLLPAEAAGYLRDVRANTQQMGRLIDDLLAFSRLIHQPLKKQPCRPADLVQECLRELQPQQEGRRVEIRMPDLPECQADPALLKQVWINLLSNALNYTGKREVALVEIGWRATDRPGEIAYFVKDNGVGFDMQYSDKLFGVFQRLHRAEDYAGTGVGLAIVQRIVHRHGGRIWAEAQPDQGATFYFTLS